MSQILFRFRKSEFVTMIEVALCNQAVKDRHDYVPFPSNQLQGILNLQEALSRGVLHFELVDDTLKALPQPLPTIDPLIEKFLL